MSLIANYILVLVFLRLSSVSLRFTRDYMCTFLGYLFYFVFISSFSWITVFGLDLYLSIHKMVRRDLGCKQNFGLSVQLSVLPIIFFLVLLLSRLFLSSENFLVSHHVALPSLVTSIFGILLLFVNLLRTCRGEDRSPVANVGLGIPLLKSQSQSNLNSR